MATPSEDPRIQEGLRQILQLDEHLMQKSVEAAMVARETFPDAWLAADKKQSERDQKLLLASLDRYHHSFWSKNQSAQHASSAEFTSDPT